MSAPGEAEARRDRRRAIAGRLRREWNGGGPSRGVRRAMMRSPDAGASIDPSMLWRHL